MTAFIYDNYDELYLHNEKSKSKPKIETKQIKMIAVFSWSCGYEYTQFLNYPGYKKKIIKYTILHNLMNFRCVKMQFSFRYFLWKVHLFHVGSHHKCISIPRKIQNVSISKFFEYECNLYSNLYNSWEAWYQYINFCSAYICHEQFLFFILWIIQMKCEKQHVLLKNLLQIACYNIFFTLFHLNSSKVYVYCFEEKANTSSYGQCSKFILSHSKTSAIVSCNSNIIPCGWF